MPLVAERVPPFAFAPPVDVIEHDGELLVERALPSVSREEVAVELTDRMLVINGKRAGEKAANGRVYRHAEIPRGPFRRVILLPPELEATAGPPRVDVENGIVRIRLGKPQRAGVPSA
jgi:HSP20 family molecular chaperone IbpA